VNHSRNARPLSLSDRPPRLGRLGLGAAIGLLVTIVAIVLGCSAASADVGPPFLREDALHLLPGVSLGGSFGPDDTQHLTLGGELSAAYFMGDSRPGYWVGAFVDGHAEVGGDGGRVSVGPQVGWMILGLDVAYVLATTGDGVHHGVSGRFSLTIGIVALSFRLGYAGGTFGEVGLVLKLPVQITGPSSPGLSW